MNTAALDAVGIAHRYIAVWNETDPARRRERLEADWTADAHGEHLRFSWTLGPSGAEDLIEGTDFAQVDGGKLRAVTGFLDKVPVGA